MRQLPEACELRKLSLIGLFPIKLSHVALIGFLPDRIAKSDTDV